MMVRPSFLCGAGRRDARQRRAWCWSAKWRGVSHRVSILDHGVVYRGQRYKSLSEVARLITGSRWSGPRFFGVSPEGGGRQCLSSQTLRDLYAQIIRRRIGSRLQLAACTARCLRGVCQKPGGEGWRLSKQHTTMAVSRAARWRVRRYNYCLPVSVAHRCSGRLQSRPADAVAGRLRPDD